MGLALIGENEGKTIEGQKERERAGNEDGETKRAR